MKNMKHILIVDDFPSGREVLREKLELQGYACQEVGNGSAALKAIETKRFDLVITDNQMPVMTGLELLQSLAERPKDQRPPAIFLTGRLSDQLAKAAQSAGAWAIMQKPYNYQELIAEITQILEPDRFATSSPSGLNSPAEVNSQQEMRTCPSSSC
jgi:two-component system chemotaxis response regulator CheY